MRMGCFQACACISSCYEFAKQTLAVTVIKLDAIRRDPEAFQKTCLIALAIIRGLNFHCHTHYFPHLISVLDTVPAFDFYGFCRLPRYFIHPYTPARLDEYAILDQLEVIFCENWHLGIPDNQGKNRDNSVRQFAKEQLTAFLEKMTEEGQDFSSAEEVKIVLHNWFEKTLEAYPQKDFDPHDLHLQDLKIDLKPTPWMEAMIVYTFVVVDVACIPDFLQGWGLIDLAPYAKQMGNFPLFSWVPRQCLDDWIWGTMGIGHFLHFLNAANALWTGKLTPGEAKDAKWLLAASIAECLYCLSVIQKKDPRFINGLALVAKSLGLIAFLVASEQTFFNDDA